MPKIEKGELRVSAIKNGSVIDHISNKHLPKVVQILNLFDLKHPITIGQNFKSSKLGRKGIIKVEEKYFTLEELNTLAIVAPDVVISTIKDYKVEEKHHVKLPAEIKRLLHCPNAKCITNNEPMDSHFILMDDQAGLLQCKYCKRKVDREDASIADEIK